MQADLGRPPLLQGRPPSIWRSAGNSFWLKEAVMLWLIAGILFALWILGLAFKVAGGLVYIALVAAVILFVVAFFRRGASSV